MTAAQDPFAQFNDSSHRAHQERLASIMDELKQAGWSQEKLFAMEPLIASMCRSLTADDLRELADLKSWSQHR